MSATAGTTLTQQGQQLGEKPQFATPYGMTFGGWELVQRYFMRSDTPNGLSTDTPTPEANQAFRNAILAGQVVPLNDAAGRMAVSIGGIQNGTMSPFGVPWIDGKPGGMTTDQWNALTASSRQKSDQKIAEAAASGYFDGKSTLERQQIEAQIRSQDFQDATSRMMTEANIRQKDTDLTRLEAERQDAVRAGDLDRAQALTIEMGQQKNQRDQWMTELTGYVEGTQGGQTTLSREQQAFDQASAVANLRANPRTGVEGWLLGQRAGLNGQVPANQVAQTTAGMPTFAAPGSTPPGTTVPEGAFGSAMANTAQATGSSAIGTPLPTSAFVESLQQGTAVPNQGAIQQQGRWWDADQFAAQVNPAQWRTQDFMRGTADEKQSALGYASLGGFSDETTQDLLRRNLPNFNAPGSSKLV